MAARVLLARGGLLRPAAHSSFLPGLRRVTSSSHRAREDSWLKSLFVRKVDPRKDAHSNLLAKRETSSLYKLQFHNVKPECLDAYNKIWCVSQIIISWEEGGHVMTFIRIDSLTRNSTGESFDPPKAECSEVSLRTDGGTWEGWGGHCQWHLVLSTHSLLLRTLEDCL